MARICTVCIHPDKEKINEALVRGESSRTISSRFSTADVTLGRMSIYRHRLAHLPHQMTMAKKADDASSADDLLAKIEELETDARSIKEQAESTGDLRMALQAVRELTRMVELMGRLRRELDNRAQVVINSQIVNTSRVDYELYDQIVAEMSMSELDSEPKAADVALDGGMEDGPEDEDQNQ